MGSSSSVASRLQDIVQHCSLILETATIGSCKSGQKKAVVKHYSESAAERAKDLIDLVQAAVGDKPETQLAAALVLHQAFFGRVAEVSSNDAKQAAAVLRGKLSSLSPALQVRLLGITLELTFRSESAQSAVDWVESLAPRTRTSGYRYLLRLGGETTLARMQEAASDVANPALALTATMSIGSWAEGQPQAKKEQLCAWARPIFLQATDSRTSPLGKLLLSCSKEYQEAYLRQLEQAVAQRTADNAGAINALSDVVAEPKKYAPEFLLKVRDLLIAQCGENAGAGAETRSVALRQLFRAWPVEARPIAERFLKSDDERLQHSASVVLGLKSRSQN